MKKKIFACLLAGAMVFSMASCGEEGDETVSTEPAQTETESEGETESESGSEGASIDFEDGNLAFVQAYGQPTDAADLEFAVADFGGSKALQVKNLTGKVPYVAIDATSLLGADVANVASIEMNIGVSYDDGSFNACSGQVILWSGADLVETTQDWSVYMESANPKKNTVSLADAPFVADAGNMFVLSLKTDNGAATSGNATMYIDDIRFLDASGSLLTADTTVAFAENAMFASSGPDWVNLGYLKNAVNFEGFACTGDGWAQNGFDMPQEILDALVPGSAVEISYASESGNMWLVFPAAAAGWMRVGDGTVAGSEDHTSAFYNTGKNTCQVTYEQIEALCGEDKSTWGATLQCESDTAWEVFSVKVGEVSPYYTLANAVEFSGFATSGDGWAQSGFDMPQEILDALVPGSAIEISYSSESGDLWCVFPAAEAGWMRVGDGALAGSEDHDLGTFDGSKCYITYEQIAALCGEDKATWGATLQCEASTAWEVYSVKVGTAVPFKMMRDPVEFSGFATSADGWAQSGFAMPQEILDALVPGAVVEISYASEGGDMWIVMNEAAAGWMRVGDGTLAGSEGHSQGAFNGNTCQITYEQIAELCGDDVSTWGTTMQCEASTAWEVFSVSVGQTK